MSSLVRPSLDRRVAQGIAIFQCREFRQSGHCMLAVSTIPLHQCRSPSLEGAPQMHVVEARPTPFRYLEVNAAYGFRYRHFNFPTAAAASRDGAAVSAPGPPRESTAARFRLHTPQSVTAAAPGRSPGPAARTRETAGAAATGRPDAAATPAGGAAEVGAQHPAHSGGDIRAEP